MLSALKFIKSSTVNAQENAMNLSNEVSHFPDEPSRFAESKVYLLEMLNELQSEFETQRSLVTSTKGMYERIFK